MLIVPGDGYRVATRSVITPPSAASPRQQTRVPFWRPFRLRTENKMLRFECERLVSACIPKWHSAPLRSRTRSAPFATDAHCCGMLASATTFFQRATWPATMVRISSGELALTSMPPVLRKRSATAGSASAVAHRVVELLQDRLRQPLRRRDADPGAHVVARHGIGDRRDVRRAPPARAAGDAEHVGLAGAELRIDHRDGVERDVDLAAEQVGHGRAAAAVRHMRHLHAGERAEPFAGEMLRRADADRRVGELAGLRPWRQRPGRPRS